MQDGTEYSCSHCGNILSPIGEQPCPYCGQTGRIINNLQESKIHLTDDIAVDLKHGETGRSARHSDTKYPTDKELIEKYIINFIEGDTSDFENYINNLVSHFISPTILESVFYRGVNSSLRNKIIGKKIGPSPNPKDGRYNVNGEKSIYLIDNYLFLPEEIGANEILVQEYRIPSVINIANLSPENNIINNSLSLIFQMTERGMTASEYNFELELQMQGKSKYFLSQNVANVFKKHGWQGLYVPGVHGKNSETYKNLVIFGSYVESWEKWAIGEFRTYSKNNGWLN